MASFGQLKNSLRRLSNCCKQMSILTNINWSRQALDQKQIKSQPVQFYLRILHYVVVDYSPSLYKQVILEVVPNIKTLPDLKFVQSTINISRSQFSIVPKITAQQFLQANKWTQKKLQYLVELCQKIYEWETNAKKRTVPKFSNKEPKNSVFEAFQKFKDQTVFDQQENQQEDDQLQVREITIQPTSCHVEHVSNSFGRMKIQQIQTKSNNLQEKGFRQREKQTISMYRNKPNVFPKAMQNQFLQDQQQLPSHYDTRNNNKNVVPKNIAQSNTRGQSNNRAQELRPDILKNEAVQTSQYVTKEQYNQLVMMLSTISNTQSDLVSKFNAFQGNVVSWFNNMNAKVSLLEQNVKMIKNNL